VIELSFVAEQSVGSSVIRWFSHSDFSHVEVIWPNDHGKRYGARSDHTPGVWSRPFNYATFSKDWRVLIPSIPEQEEGFYTFLLDQYGKPYDKSGLFASFLFGRKVKWRDDQSWWCSELVAAALEAGGLTKFMTPAGRITPNDAFLVSAAIPGATISVVR
jgi:hypothetical protein